MPKNRKIDQDNLRMKFSALNADCSSPSADPLGLRMPAHANVKRGTLLKVIILLILAYLA